MARTPKYCLNHLDRKASCKGLCKTCYSRKWYKELTPEKKKDNSNRRKRDWIRLASRHNLCRQVRYLEFKKAVFEFYGNKCNKCGNADLRVLQVDHKEGGGLKHRKEVGGGCNFYKSVLSNPDRFQLLCANCNWLKRVENNEGNGYLEISQLERLKGEKGGDSSSTSRGQQS